MTAENKQDRRTVGAGAAQEQGRQAEWKNSLVAWSGDCCGRYHPGGNLVLIVIGGVILGLGQMVRASPKSRVTGRPSMPLLRTSWEPS